MKTEFRLPFSSAVSPSTLNRGEMRDALDDIRDMAAFLQVALAYIDEGGAVMSETECNGRNFCLRIIQDTARVLSDALDPDKEARNE